VSVGPGLYQTTYRPEVESRAVGTMDGVEVNKSGVRLSTLNTKQLSRQTQHT